ncbi:MAG: potassium channel family protein [Arachnia sp.]
MLGRPKRNQDQSRELVLVVGLGLFGSAVAATFKEVGVDFVAISENAQQVERYADDFDRVIEMDPSDREALEQIGIDRVSKAVVALSKVELSIMTVLALNELGVKQIWARAATREHAEILRRIGVHKVVLSEASTGRRVAHAVSGSMADYFEFEDGFAIARTVAPDVCVDRPLSQSDLRAKFNVTVVGIKRTGQPFFYAEPESVPQHGDELIVSGRIAQVDQFCRLSRGLIAGESDRTS